MKHKQRSRSTSIVISMLVVVIFALIPPPPGMTGSAMQLIGIFIGTLILWMTVSIDWPSMLCMLLIILLLPEISVSSMLSASVGSATFSFLLFTFICTYAVGTTPFIRRVALRFVTGHIAQRGSWSFIVMYLSATLILGLFMSPTVLVVIMLALNEEIFKVLQLEKGSTTARMMTMGMVFASGISAGMTPIAHVFPLLSIGVYETATNNAITYFQYMTVSVPVGLLAFIIMLLIFRLFFKPDVGEIKTEDTLQLKKNLPSFSQGEIVTLIVFFGVIMLWVLPGLLKPAFPGFYSAINKYGTAMPPLLGAVLLSIISFNGKPLVDFKDATSKGVPWASLIMVSGTLALSSALTNDAIGLTAWVSEKLQPLAATLPPMSVVLLFALWAALQTNLSSNMVTATVVATIAMAVAGAYSGALNVPALICVIGMLSAFAFATPPAMATVAFAIGSGWCDAKSFAKYGSILAIVSALLAAFIGYGIGTLVF